MNFWDTYDEAAVLIELSPHGREIRAQALAQQQRQPYTGESENLGSAGIESGVPATPSSQNDTSGVCAFCHIAGDDVLLGVCTDCT